MPNPRTLISSYPPDTIDKAFEAKHFSKVHVYLDMKNAMTSLFIEDVMNEIVWNTHNQGKIDSSIFQSLFLYSVWWKSFCVKRNVDYKMFIVTDKGISRYHRGIYEGYKAERDIASSELTAEQRDVREKFLKIRRQNSSLAENVFSRLPFVYFLNLDFLETDFLPYYLITRKFSEEKDTLHIVVSNDKDMYQMLHIPNVLQIYKMKDEKRIVHRNNFMIQYCKLKTDSIKSREKNMKHIKQFNPKYFPAYMSIMGDAIDGIPGVSRMGPKTTLPLFSDPEILNRVIGTPEELDDRVAAGGDYFKELNFNDSCGAWDKLFEKDNFREIVNRSFKLISFEQLARWLEKRDNTMKTDWLKRIDEGLDKNTSRILPPQTVLKSFSTLEDCYLTENDVNLLYEGADLC
jgi:hypothetical protein